MQFQTTKTRNANRKDHIWLWRGRDYICCLCGAIDTDPPGYPTPKDYLPTTYVRLTDEERGAVNRRGSEY